MLQVSVFRHVLIWGICAIGMVIAMPNAFYSRVELANDARVALETGAAPTEELETRANSWPTFLPSALVNLGLDLRGGAHLLAEVQVGEVHAARLDGMWPDVRDALRERRETVGTIRRQESTGPELRVRISNPDAINVAVAAVEELARPVGGLTGPASDDIEVTSEGADVVVTLSEAEKARSDRSTMEQSLEIIRRRVDEAGTREPAIQRQGDHRILIQVPGIGSAEDLKALIGKTAKLTFHTVEGQTSNPEERVRSGQILLPAEDGSGISYILQRTPTISGDHLVDAQPSFDQNNQPAVSFRLNPAGGANLRGVHCPKHRQSFCHRSR